MDEEHMSLSELREKREKEALIEMGRYEIGDPNRAKAFTEAKGFADIRNNDETAEMNRTNNYAKNDMEEQRLEIERQKVANDRKRYRMDWLKIFCFAGFQFGGTWVAYNMDKTENAYRKTVDWLKDMTNDLKRRF